jgi:threonine 3-dehydrogenase
LLRTRFYRPSLPSDLVDRPRLTDQLNHSADYPLTLVTAPAGYGKSILVSSWLSTCERPSAWLSLDETVDDLGVFLAHFVAAIQAVFPGTLRQNVLVNGCGPVRLAIAQLSLTLGATHVVAVEPNSYRRKQAEALGATVLEPRDPVVDVCRDLARSRGGFDVAFEVSGVRGVLPTLFESLRREATLVTIGHPSEPAPIDIAAYINKKQITLRGIFGRRLWDTWEQLLLLVESGRVDLSWLVSHRLPLSAADEAIELLTGDANKVLLIPTLT